MKKTLFVLSIFVLTTAAFAQYGGVAGYISSEPQVFHAPEHTQHAGFAPLRSETSIYPGTSYTSAQGDRPPSDFPQAASASLGDIARELKKQHEQVKKSTTVWINQ
ncbi:MAG TPA: hypothetical protein VMT67_13640 [Terriglobales bacterium]|nr:hypothetical protein [Terriglobales bacterium]